MATKRRRPTEDDQDGTGVGEFRSGPVAGVALLDGATFRRKPVLYSEVDGLALFEGDIVVGPIDTVRRSADRGQILESVGITGSQFRWPDATVPFTIDGSLPNQSRVTDAIAHWEVNTRIRLVPRDPARHSNWVNFVAGGGCSSAVGMQGGQQNITLGSGCTTGNAIHEIGHALGLWHEQSREDRDSFVQIVFANIDPTKVHNFTQHITDGDDLGAYDYGSLMHYPPSAFSTNGQDTIVPLQPLPPGVVMGQRDGLSAGDVAGIHALYPGPVVTLKEALKDAGSDPVLTLKEALKDAGSDPVLTQKEIAADPVTLKEALKDAGADPVFTTKEIAADVLPTPFPGPSPAQTFVTGAPSRVPGAVGAVGAAGAPGDGVQQLAALVAQLAQAVAGVQQQQAAIAAAYDGLVAQLAQGQGSGQG